MSLMNTDPFPLLSKTDEEIMADCVKYVDERIADRDKAVSEGKDPSIYDFIGCLGYGAASDPREEQIAMGYAFMIHAREDDRKAKAEWDKLMAKWGDRLVLDGPPEGKCPVQCDGKFDGKTLYFRARWDHWRLDINDETVAEDMYGDSGFDAGWMDAVEALKFIGQGLEEYTKPKDT